MCSDRSPVPWIGGEHLSYRRQIPLAANGAAKACSRPGKRRRRISLWHFPLPTPRRTSGPSPVQELRFRRAVMPRGRRAPPTSCCVCFPPTLEPGLQYRANMLPRMTPHGPPGGDGLWGSRRRGWVCGHSLTTPGFPEQEQGSRTSPPREDRPPASVCSLIR